MRKLIVSTYATLDGRVDEIQDWALPYDDAAVARYHDDRLANMEHGHKHIRPIDAELSYVHKDLSSRFAYVARARANIWLTTAVVLFIVGFVLGVIYVADPSIITKGRNGVNSTIKY